MKSIVIDIIYRALILFIIYGVITIDTGVMIRVAATVLGGHYDNVAAHEPDAVDMTYRAV